MRCSRWFKYVAVLALCNFSACAHRTAEETLPTPPVASTPDALASLYDCVTGILETRPRALYWVHPLQGTEGAYVTTSFHWDTIRKYSGHEVIIFTRNQAAYYWMPGAKPDATGEVALGTYPVEATLPGKGNRRVGLYFEKRHPTAFVLVQQENAPKPGLAQISPRPLPPEYIAAELHELAWLGIQFFVHELLAGGTRAQTTELLRNATFLGSCRNHSPRLDTSLGELKDLLESP
jgi:hypothetical protein